MNGPWLDGPWPTGRVLELSRSSRHWPAESGSYGFELGETGLMGLGSGLGFGVVVRDGKVFVEMTLRKNVDGKKMVMGLGLGFGGMMSVRDGKVFVKMTERKNDDGKEMVMVTMMVY